MSTKLDVNSINWSIKYASRIYVKYTPQNSAQVSTWLKIWSTKRSRSMATNSSIILFVVAGDLCMTSLCTWQMSCAKLLEGVFPQCSSPLVWFYSWGSHLHWKAWWFNFCWLSSKSFTEDTEEILSKAKDAFPGQDTAASPAGPATCSSPGFCPNLTTTFLCPALAVLPTATRTLPMFFPLPGILFSPPAWNSLLSPLWPSYFFPAFPGWVNSKRQVRIWGVLTCKFLHSPTRLILLTCESQARSTPPAQRKYGMTHSDQGQRGTCSGPPPATPLPKGRWAHLELQTAHSNGSKPTLGSMEAASQACPPKHLVYPPLCPGGGQGASVGKVRG